MNISNLFISWIPTNNCCLDKNKIPSKNLDVESSFSKENRNILYISMPFTLDFSDSFSKDCEIGIGYKIVIDFSPDKKRYDNLFADFKEYDFWKFKLKIFL